MIEFLQKENNIKSSVPSQIQELEKLRKQVEEYRKKYPALKDIIPIVSSDAHYLWLINDAANSIELSGETEDEIRKSLIRKLRNI